MAQLIFLISNFVGDEVLAPVAHRQMVFTLPKILRPHFKLSIRRTRLCQIMHQTVATFMSEALGFDGRQKRAARAGVIAVLQTFGSELNFNPHVHAIAAEGLFLNDAFHPCPLTRSDWATLEDLFRARVLRYLVKQKCLTEERAENILAWRHTSGFGVNAQVLIPVGDHAGMERLCRYISRPALSFERIQYDEHTGRVTILSHKKNREGQRDEVCQISVMDLLVRLKHQVPPKGSHAQRYYGYYSSKMRGQRLQSKAGTLKQHETKRQKVKKKTWARLIRQVFEVDPLSCPKCGGQMAFVAFIQRGQKDVIQKILSSLNVPIPDVETMMRGPPLWMQIQQAQAWMDDHPDFYTQDEQDLDQSPTTDEETYFLDPP